MRWRKHSTEELIEEAKQLIGDHLYTQALDLLSEAQKRVEIDQSLLNTAIYGKLLEDLLEECDKFVESEEGDEEYLRATIRSHYGMFKRYAQDDPFKIDDATLFEDMSRQLHHRTMEQLAVMTARGSSLDMILREFGMKLQRAVVHGKRLGYDTRRLEIIHDMCVKSRERIAGANAQLAAMCEKPDSEIGEDEEESSDRGGETCG